MNAIDEQLARDTAAMPRPILGPFSPVLTGVLREPHVIPHDEAERQVDRFLDRFRPEARKWAHRGVRAPDGFDPPPWTVLLGAQSVASAMAILGSPLRGENDMRFKTVVGAALLAGGALLGAGCTHQGGHDRTSGEVLDDSAITAKVKSALLAEKDVNSFDIKVQTFNGVVQLSGFVDSKWQIDKAIQVASSVNGVQKVENDLIHKAAD